MKDLIIKGFFLKREIKIYLICLVIAVIIHVSAILFYKTNWMELLTAFYYTFFISLLFYLIVCCARLIWTISGLIVRKKN